MPRAGLRKLSTIGMEKKSNRTGNQEKNDVGEKGEAVPQESKNGGKGTGLKNRIEKKEGSG